MCTGAEIGLIIGGVSAAGSLYSAVSGSKKAETPAIQAPVAPPVAAQDAKTPDASGIKKATAAAYGGGESSTMLTGLDGIAPSSLNLAKNTLLGA